MIDAVITFNYSAGSNPGAKRTVFVTKSDGCHVWGYDLDREETRQFLVHKMSNEKSLKGVDLRIINTNNLPNGYSPDSLVDDYADEGYEAHQYGSFVIALKRPDDCSIKHTYRSYDFKTPRGRIVLEQNRNGVAVLVTLFNALDHPVTQVEIEKPAEFHAFLGQIL